MYTVLWIIFLMFDVSAASGRINPLNSDALFGAESNIAWIQVPRKRHHHQHNHHRSDSFIINGDEAVRGAHPWLISLQLKNRGQWVHICGGAVLDETTVLTAAHCLPYWGEMEHRVCAGWHDLEEDSGDTQQERRAVDAVMHPDYLGGVSPNDIAVITLDEPLHFNDHVQPAVLSEEDDVFVGDECTVAGWGKMEDHVMATELQSTRVPVIALSLCIDYWRINSDMQILPSNMCAFSSRNGTGILSNVCNGDSGGPLVCHNVTVGLVSWGRTGCVGCSPDVYTRVAAFRPWISDVMSAAH